MKYEIKIPFFLAFRQLARGSKWTLALTIFLMAAVFINLIFVSALFRGIVDGSNDQTINMNTGHIVITPNGDTILPQKDSIISKIEENTNIEALSDQLQLNALLSLGENNGTWNILAIDPEKEKSVTHIYEKLFEGEYLETDDKDGILIGRQISGGEGVEFDVFSLHANVGDKVNVRIDNQEREFIVRGIFYSKYVEADMRAFITRTGLSEIAPEMEDATNRIIIRATEDADLDLILSDFESRNIAGTFYTWEDMAGVMKSVTQSFLSIDVILSTVASLIAAVTIFIVVYIDISNRRQQIGILRAIGIKPYIIRTTYVIISTFYSVIGVSVGIGLFYGIIVPYFIANPFSLPIVDATLVVSPADFIIRAESIILISILVSLIPSFMITRMKLLNAIWGK
jgi:putative ABC transport system permease protein